MLKVSLSLYNHLYCIRHKEKKNPLTIETYLYEDDNNNDCKEGMLICQDCKAKYPIIDGIAIIVENFSNYCSERTTAFGKWLLEVQSEQLRNYLKDVANTIDNKNIKNNRYEMEGQYYQSYKWLHNENFESDKFLLLMRWKIKPSDVYKKLTSSVIFNPEGMALDLGCALGLLTFELSKKFSFVFGVDLSFAFVREARKKMKELRITNVEFIVSDVLKVPFKSHKFDLVFGLNIIEFTPMTELLKEVHEVLKPHCNLIITSPYDYNREYQPDISMDENLVRKIVEKNGFEIAIRTKKESFIPWILKINERTYLFYFLDLIEAKKTSKHKY